MISPELIRRYSFFSCLNHEQITAISMNSAELSVKEGEYFFHEGDKLDHFYLIIEGSVAVNLEITDREKKQSVSDQLVGNLETKEIIICTLGSGDIFGISAIVPPNFAASSAKSFSASRVIRVDCGPLREDFNTDTQFGYTMALKAAQIFRERLRNVYIETIASNIK
ncbi:MAG: cyclic nucleotide-binding domain-containing protein [Anaerolineales bacterium]